MDVDILQRELGDQTDALYPLTMAQREVWLAQKQHPDQPLYNVGCIFELQGPIDPVVFERALRQAVQDLDALRLVIRETEEGPKLAFGSVPEVVCPVVALTHEPDPDSAAHAWIARDLDHPFDLARGPLVRFTLFKLSEARFLWFQLVHHLVTDAAGRILVDRHVAALYGHLTRGTPRPTPPPSCLTLLSEERDYLASPRWEQDRCYWRERLTDRPAPASLSGQPPAHPDLGRKCQVTLPRSALDVLDTLATSLPAALLAIVAAYLARMTQTEDLVLGIPVAGRTGPRMRSVVGLASKAFPLRLSLPGTATLRDVIAEAGRQLRGALRHQRYPSSALRQDLGLAPDQPDGFAAVINIIPLEDDLTFAGVPVRVEHPGHWRVDDLLVHVRLDRTAETLPIELIGNRSRYDPATLHAHAHRLLAFVTAWSAAPDTPLEAVPLLTDADRRIVLPPSPDVCEPGPPFPALFEPVAAARPDSVALTDGHRSLTYEQLNQAANHLAHALIARGIGPEALVGICIGRSIEMVVAVLATLKAGGAYLPLDPAYPAARLAFMMTDARPALVLTDRRSRSSLPTEVETLDLDGAVTEGAAPNPADTDRTVPLQSAHPAYVIYTSGSTGIPKGVVVTHAGIAALNASYRDRFGVTATSRVLQFASLSFDASFSELLMAFVQGATLVLPPADALGGSALRSVLVTERITHATLPPVVLATLEPGDDLPLEHLIVAGEACPPYLVELWSAGRRMINAYGPTESTVAATMSAPLRGGSAPIGTPISGTHIYVLDRAGQPVPVGVSGELCIAGVGLARGYLNRPGLTAERFVPNPFGPPGSRLYRSGDLARWRSDGALDYLGRIDHQVKIRGIRAEPGEVETVLAAEPAISQAAVLAREGGPDGAQLIAYVVGKNGEAPLDPSAVRRRLVARLPAHLIPTTIVVLDALPISPNRKLDRDALLQAAAEQRGQETADTPPSGPVETQIAALFAELLGAARAGRHDSFFELGGSSLGVIALVERLRKQGWNIDVRTVFEHPTPAKLAEALSARDSIHLAQNPPIPVDPLPPVPADSRPPVRLDQGEFDRILEMTPGGAANLEDIYPLAPLQEGLLVHSVLGDDDIYLAFALLSFDSRVEAERSLVALQSLIDRHAVLRTAIIWEGLSEPVQVVWRQAALPMDTVALANSEHTSDLFKAWRELSQHHAISLRQAPLLRTLLTEDPTQSRWLLLLIVHRMVIDHASLEQIVTEMRISLTGGTLPPAEPGAFRRFVAETRRDGAAAFHASFFRTMLANVPPQPAPFGLPDSVTRAESITESRQALIPALAASLRAAARTAGVTSASLFHLAWALVLGRAGGRADLVFGTVLLGRSQGSAIGNRALGPFINTLPLRISLDATPLMAALLQVQADLAQLLQHEQASLAAAQRCSPLPAGAPLITSVLNFRHTGHGAMTPGSEIWPGARLLRVELRSTYPLSLSVDSHDGGFTLVAQAASPVAPARICALMSTALNDVVEALEQAPQISLGRLAFPHPLASSASADPVSSLARPPGAPPQTNTEQWLARVWNEFLPAARITRDDDFFDLGGHSLMALRVIARIQAHHNLDLPLKTLFEARTLAATAAAIDTARKAPGPQPLLPRIPAHSAGTVAPLSYSQERMWLIQSLHPETTAYNIAGVLRLTGDFDWIAARSAFQALFARHETLRATIVLQDGRPLQSVDPTAAPPLEFLDLSGQADPAAEGLRLAEAETRRVFDLARGPVIRVTALRIAPNQHLLVIAMHHVAGDQWSIGIFGRELAHLYNAAKRGAAPILEALPIRYQDYAAWQRAGEFGAELERQRTFWHERLRDLPVLTLPTDRPRPLLQSLAGAVHIVELSPDRIDRLEALSRRLHGTLFMTLFAAFVVLLHRISGQTDIAIGVPVANRRMQETESLIGTFVNTIVLRTDVSADPRFTELFERVRRASLDAFAHQDFPFDRLVQEIGQRQDPSRAPLVQVLFNLANAPFSGIELDGLEWEPVPLDRQGAQFELSLAVDPQVTRSVMVEYNTALFDHETIIRFVAQYETLLDGVLAAPETPVSLLPLLPSSQQALLDAWNDTQALADPDARIFSRRFERQAARTPDAQAVTCAGASLTYGALNARANGLARRLLALGAGRGAVVAICLERSLDLLVALLAVQKSGAAYVPLDPRFPPARLEFMLGDSGARLLIGKGSAPGGLAVPDEVAVIDPETPTGAAENFESGPEPGDVAYLLYTSGSTGRPKGVVIRHGALANFLDAMHDAPGIDASDVLAAVTTISFDIAGLELYLPLLVGARIELVPADIASDGGALAELLQASGATMLQATPATWRLLLQAGWNGHPGFRALCGGEKLPRDLADAILPRVDALWNLYGPTETTIWSTVARVTAVGAPVTIGRPIRNTQIHVLDGAGEKVPIGVAGEICIGGDGVALGYHRRPALTAERFIADRFAGRPGARLYRTGDLGRWDETGCLHHLGRMDDQVKLRGFRIELGEIEAALRTHPAVEQAVVAIHEPQPDDQRLVGYIVCRSGEAPTSTELRRFLQQSLPDYMVPGLFLTLDALPLTPNGKIDRRGLPAPFQSDAETTDDFVPPAPGLEQTIAAIWGSMLQTGRIGAEDNFFELGGHSLLSLRVVHEIRKRTGYRLDPRALFFSNLRQIAGLVVNATKPR